MKRHIFLFLIVVLSSSLSAQRIRYYDRDIRENVTTNIHGDLEYQNSEGLKAKLSQNIFGDQVYEDNRKNKVTYAKNIWQDIFPEFRGNKRRILSALAEAFGDKNDVVEKYERNIHDDIVYERGRSFRATLSQNIFDDGVYSDNSRNEIKFSKEYWQEIVRDFNGNEVQVFFWLLDRCEGLNNFKEEYDVDIFGHLQYSNNKRQKASLSKDIFDKKIYEDSNRNKEEYTPSHWRRIIRKYGSEKKYFMELVEGYLFDK